MDFGTGLGRADRSEARAGDRTGAFAIDTAGLAATSSKHVPELRFRDEPTLEE